MGEGRLEGRAEEKQEIARNLLAIVIDTASISKATGLPENEILSLK